MYVILQGGLGLVAVTDIPTLFQGLAQQKLFIFSCVLPLATKRTPVLVALRGLG